VGIGMYCAEVKPIWVYCRSWCLFDVKWTLWPTWILKKIFFVPIGRSYVTTTIGKLISKSDTANHQSWENWYQNQIQPTTNHEKIEIKIRSSRIKSASLTYNISNFIIRCPLWHKHWHCRSFTFRLFFPISIYASGPFASAVLHPRDIWQLKALFSVVFS